MDFGDERCSERAKVLLSRARCRAVPERCDGAGLPWPGHQRPGAAELRGAARDVSPPDVRGQYGSRGAGCAGCLGVGARVQGCREQARRYQGEQALIEGCERLAELASELADTRLVSVADLEADITMLMRRADELGTPVDWLIRSTHDAA